MEFKRIAYLAVDTAYEHGRVVLFADGVVHDEVLATKLSHGRSLCGAIERTLTAARAHGYDIGAVFAGIGPGSFVGIRISLATLLGFSFAKDLPIIGFCSPMALAYSHDFDVDEHALHLFMKASGELGYLASYHRVDGQLEQRGPIIVVHIDEVPERIGNDLVLSDRGPSLTSMVADPARVQPICGPNADGMSRACLAKIAELGALIDESDHIKPNYIKAPNVSLPKKNLVIWQAKDCL